MTSRIILLLCLIALGPLASANSFDGDGLRYVTPGNANDGATGTAIAIDQDGGFFAAGTSTELSGSYNRTLRLQRFLADGSDDPAFSPISRQGSPYLSIPNRGLLIQPDGKVILTWQTANSASPSDTYSRIERFTASGASDPDFTPFSFEASSGADQIDALALQTDGRIVVAGSMPGPNGGERLAIAFRLNADGSLDSGFGSDGFVRYGATTVPGMVLADAQFKAIGLLPDGRIFLAGTLMHSTFVDSRMQFVRLMSDGSPDESFNNGERLLYRHYQGASGALQSRLQSVDVAADGTFLVGGVVALSSTEVCLMQFHPSGTEPTFPGTGSVAPQSFFCNDMGLSEYVGDVQFLPNGGALAVGTFHDSSRTYGFYAVCNTGVAFCGGFEPRFLSTQRSHSLSTLAYDPHQSRVLAIGDGTRMIGGQPRTDWLLLSDGSPASLDVVPDPISVTSQSNVAVSTAVSSAPFNIQGVSELTRLPVRVLDGRFSSNGVDLVGMPGDWPALGFYTASGSPAGLTATLSHVSAASLGETTETDIEVGGVVRSNNLALTIGPTQVARFSSTTGTPALPTQIFRDGYEP